MFEFLFKYPAADFAAGEVVSLLSAWQLALLPLVLAAGAYLLLGTYRLGGRVRRRDRVAVSLLRGCALAIALFSLSQPLLEISSATPQPGLVAVLLDNSISMRLAHSDGGARGDYLRREFDPGPVYPFYPVTTDCPRRAALHPVRCDFAVPGQNARRAQSIDERTLAFRVQIFRHFLKPVRRTRSQRPRRNQSQTRIRLAIADNP